MAFITCRGLFLVVLFCSIFLMKCEILGLDFIPIQLKFGLVNHEVQSLYLLEFSGKMMRLSKLFFFSKILL